MKAKSLGQMGHLGGKFFKLLLCTEKYLTKGKGTQTREKKEPELKGLQLPPAQHATPVPCISALLWLGSHLELGPLTGRLAP